MISGGLSAMSAIGGHQSAQDQANAANAGALRSYRHQLQQRDIQWNQARNQWDIKKLNYEKGIVASDNAIGRAYAANQQKLNETFTKVAFQRQAQFAKLVEKQGLIGAKGISGNSKARAQVLAAGEFGRNQAIAAESLASSEYAMKQRNEDVHNKAQAHRDRLYSDVTFAPQIGAAPVKPVMQDGPSPFSLIAGLGQAGLGAYNMYQDSLDLPNGQEP